jgi:hypothetical protein
LDKRGVGSAAPNDHQQGSARQKKRRDPKSPADESSRIAIGVGSMHIGSAAGDGCEPTRSRL